MTMQDTRNNVPAAC